jgi:LysM repeat protein
VVNEGDTLWEIAERLRPAEDPRKTVDEIVEINGLTEPVLTPGQELVLPSP